MGYERMGADRYDEDAGEIRGRRMKIRKKLWKRILSMVLCIALMLGCFPMTAMALGDVEVTVEKLEELAEPTEFPAKGMMHAQIVTGMSVDSNGKENYTYKEVYLSVYVNDNKEVFADLDVLSTHLGYWYEMQGDTIIVKVNDTNNLIFRIGDPEVAYVNYLITSSVNMGAAPFIYEDDIYVPLDAFIQVTGASGAYLGENELGKEELYLVPPQKTVLDDMARFCENAYNRYVFTFSKDLKYTDDKSVDQESMALVVKYLEGMLKLDWRSWMVSINPVGGERKYGLMDDTNVDAFMDQVLKLNAQSMDAMVDSSQKIISILGVVMDVASNMTDEYLDSQIGLAAINVSANETMFSITQNAKFLTNAYQKIELGERLTKYKNILKGVDAVNLATGSINAYLTIYNNLSNGCDWSIDGATYINEYRSKIQNKIINDDNIKRVESNIKKYKGRVENQAFVQFVKEYSWDLAKGTLAFAFAPAQAAKLVSDVYGAAADVISDVAMAGGLEQADSYLSASFGIEYETEALQTVFAYIDRYIEESKNGMASKSISDEEMRKVFYHAMTACYATREFGCAGAKRQLKKYPELASLQENYNQELAEMMGRTLNMDVPMGLDYCNLSSLQISKLDHFPNVVFNLIHVQGEILSLEDEKPAKGVDVKILDEDGEELAKFTTEKDGMFDIAFEVEEADPFSEEPLMKNLTFHMEYKRYEPIMENVEVQVFQKSRIDGLRVGEVVEEILAYVVGASTLDGKTVLDIQRIGLTENSWQFDFQDWFEDYSKTYADFRQDSTVSDTIEKIVLEDDVTFETVYSKMMGEGSWGGDIMAFTSELTGHSYPSIVPEGLIKTKLHDAGDVQTYINEYYKINQQYPTFEIKKINSMASSLEPVIVYR